MYRDKHDEGTVFIDCKRNLSPKPDIIAVWAYLFSSIAVPVMFSVLLLFSSVDISVLAFKVTFCPLNP